MPQGSIAIVSEIIATTNIRATGILLLQQFYLRSVPIEFKVYCNRSNRCNKYAIEIVV